MSDDYYDVKGMERIEGFVVNRDIADWKRFENQRSRFIKDKEMNERIESLEKEILNLKRALTEIHNRIS